MIILAHRGWWTLREEQNSLQAFGKAFRAGHGVELDVRDLDGTLVVSHDPPVRGALPLEEALRLYADCGAPGWLALNIKADGLCPALHALLEGLHLVDRCFVFDASVPDLRAYLRTPIPTFTRYSDAETTPSFLEASAGVWVDTFDEPWASITRATEELRAGRMAALVSPELHRRPHGEAWAEWSGALREAAAAGLPLERLMLCTDFPDAAEEAFAWMRAEYAR